MKKSSALLFTLFLCFGAFTVSAQQDARKNIEKALVDYFNALAVQDLSTLKRYSTEDILILENGATWNMDTIVNRVNIAKGMVLKRTNHLRFLRTEVHGDQGFVAYDNRADIVMADQVVTRHWLESANLVKRDGVWKIWFLHSTKLEN
jgi:ketosteroid isomerase-like protein